MLPVAGVDLHRRFPARHRRVRQLRPRRRVQGVLRPRGRAAHVSDRSAARRLRDRADGQVPQRVPRDPRAHRRRADHVASGELHPARIQQLGRGRLGLSRVQLHAQSERDAPALRPQAVRLPHRRDRARRRAVHQPRRQGRQAVLPRAGDVRAPFPVHARPPGRERLSGTEGATPAQLRRPADAARRGGSPATPG